MHRSSFFAPCLAAWWAFGCAGTRPAYDAALPRRTGDPAVAGVITGAAVVTYGVAGGCKIAGCPADTLCNPGTERCERIACGGPTVDVDVCPPSSQCSSVTATCVPF